MSRLCMTLAMGESVLANGAVRVHVLKAVGSRIRLVFEASPDVQIVRIPAPEPRPKKKVITRGKA